VIEFLLFSVVLNSENFYTQLKKKFHSFCPDFIILSKHQDTFFSCKIRNNKIRNKNCCKHLTSMGPNSDIIVHRDSADVTNILTYLYID